MANDRFLVYPTIKRRFSGWRLEVDVRGSLVLRQWSEPTRLAHCYASRRSLNRTDSSRSGLAPGTGVHAPIQPSTRIDASLTRLRPEAGFGPNVTI